MKNDRIINIVFFLCDLMCVTLVFLPLYSCNIDGSVYGVHLFKNNNMYLGIKITILCLYALLTCLGIVEFIFSYLKDNISHYIINLVSIIISVLLVFFNAFSGQMYITIVLFMITILKGSLINKRENYGNS